MNSKKMKIIVASGVLALLLSSCISTKTLVIDVEKPPVIFLSPSIKNIAIVNNAVIQPSDMGHKNLIVGRQESSIIEVPNDSVDIILMQTLANEFKESNRYNSVFLYEYPTRTDLNYKIEIPLSKDKLIEIGKETDSEAILSINTVYIETVYNSLPSYDYNIDSYNKLDMTLDLKMTFYSGMGEPISPTIEIQDTVYWIEALSMDKVISEPIPSRENAMKAGAELLAKIINTKMDISTERTIRTYYNDIKDANRLADNNDWNGAKAIWIESFDRENKTKKKARIASNIALSYELTDDIDNAIKWIEIAAELFSQEQLTSIDSKYLETSEIYKQELLERKIDFKVLDQIN